MTKRENDVLRDLASDVRFTRRVIALAVNVEENRAYEEKCISQFRRLWSVRRTAEFGVYGWPKCLEKEKR